MTKSDEIQIDFYRKLSGEERIKIAAEIRELSLRLMEAGIRDSHPQWSDDRVRLAMIFRILPPDLFKKAYGTPPL
ncbi:hypothetical protein ACFL6Y_11975 [Elusimicrobiota bacterium]